MRQRIAAHPVLAFVLLAYGFSYLVGGPFMMALQAVLPWSRAPLGSYLARALVVFGPAFAALVVTRATSGRAGIARLLGRFRLRRSDLPYVLALPLVALGVTAGGYLL